MNLSAAASAPESVPAFRKWTCAVCAYVYDEALGDPDHGLAPATRYEAIPGRLELPRLRRDQGGFLLLRRLMRDAQPTQSAPAWF